MQNERLPEQNIGQQERAAVRIGMQEYADTVESEKLAELNKQYQEVQNQIAPLMAQLVKGSELRRKMTPEQITIADRMEDDINKTLEPLFAIRTRLQGEIEGEKAGKKSSIN